MKAPSHKSHALTQSAKHARMPIESVASVE